MKNNLQPGNIVDLTAPAGGLASGQGHLFGALFGIATTAADAGRSVAVALEGVFILPKVVGTSFAEGDPAYWDGTEITGDDVNDQLVGHAVAVASADASSVEIRIKN